MKKFMNQKNLDTLESALLLLDMQMKHIKTVDVYGDFDSSFLKDGEYITTGMLGRVRKDQEKYGRIKRL